MNIIISKEKMYGNATIQRAYVYTSMYVCIYMHAHASMNVYTYVCMCTGNSEDDIDALAATL